MTDSRAAQWLDHLGAALMHALFVPQCGGCGITLNSMTHERLCGGCELARVANDGIRCATCDAPGDTRLCARCAHKPPPFVRLRAPWLYGGITADFIRRGKFNMDEALIEGAACSVLHDAQVAQLAMAADYVVPVPLGRHRLLERGFNQSAIIARTVGRRYRKPVRYALRRVRDTAPQSALSLAERGANMQQAFVPRLSLSGTALLVDDVVTSGETVSQAARALLDAGIRQVTVLAVARAPDPSWNQTSNV